MSDDTAKRAQKPAPTLAEEVGARAQRKLAARKSKSQLWFGLGMMGLIGWSIVTPTLVGAGVGIWIDRGRTGSYSWTLALMMAGLIVGCVHAWYWIATEDESMHDRGDKRDA